MLSVVMSNAEIRIAGAMAAIAHQRLPPRLAIPACAASCSAPQ